MKNQKIENEKRIINASIVAGIMFLFNLIIPTLGYVFIQSKLYTITDPLQTVINVTQNQSVFYLGIISELILSVGLVALAYSLYILVRKINKDLALFAVIVKSIEAALMAVVALITFLAFHLTGSVESIENVNISQLQLLSGIILNKHSLLNSIPMIFLGLEMVIFNLLLLRSVLVPKLISGFGVLSFALIFIYSILSILNIGSDLMLLTVPSFLYELICGIWLITKGPGRIRLMKTEV